MQLAPESFDVYGGHYADATTLTGEVSIRNEDNEPYAVHIIYDNVPENEYIYEPDHECDIYALGKWPRQSQSTEMF